MLNLSIMPNTSSHCAVPISRNGRGRSWVDFHGIHEIRVLIILHKHSLLPIERKGTPREWISVRRMWSNIITWNHSNNIFLFTTLANKQTCHYLLHLAQSTIYVFIRVVCLPSTTVIYFLCSTCSLTLCSACSLSDSVWVCCVAQVCGHKLNKYVHFTRMHLTIWYISTSYGSTNSLCKSLIWWKKHSCAHQTSTTAIIL